MNLRWRGRRYMWAGTVEFALELRQALSRSSEGKVFFTSAAKAKIAIIKIIIKVLAMANFIFFHFVFSLTFSFLSINMYVLIVQDAVISCPLPFTSFLSPMEISETLIIRGNLATFSKK